MFKKSIQFLTILIVTSTQFSIAQDLEFKKIKWDENPPVPSTTGNAAYAGEVLFSHAVIEYRYDEKGDLKKYYGIHKKIRINEENFVQSVNKIYIPYNQKDIVLFQSRAISKTGAVKETSLDKLKEIEEDGSKYKIVAVEGLEKGGEVEYLFCYQTAPKYYLSENLQLKIPVYEEKVEIISPENLKFAGKLINAEGVSNDTVIDEKRFLSFQLKDIPPFEDEKYTAQDANEVRLDYKLNYNTSKSKDKLFSWGESGKRTFDAFHIGQEASLKDVKKFIAKLDLKNLSLEEQLFKIEAAIKTDIAINSEAETIENVGTIIKNKFGNKDDITRLFLFVLEDLGIKYELVVTCNRFDKKFDPQFETWDFLEEYLIYFPELKKFIDPSNRLSRLYYAPFSNAGNNGLFIKPVSLGNIKSGAASVKMIETPVIDGQLTASECEIRIENSETTKIKYYQGMYGYYADSYRPIYYFTDEKNKKEFAEGTIKSMFSNDIKIENMVVNNFNIDNPVEFNKPFEIRADVSSTALIEKANETLLLKIGETIGPQEQMYNEKPRAYPIELSFPHQYKRKIILHIPQGYKLKGAENLKINIEFSDNGKKLFGFTSDYTIKDDVLTAEVHEFYTQIYYPKTFYEDFKKVINAAADFNKIVLLLEKTN